MVVEKTNQTEPPKVESDKTMDYETFKIAFNTGRRDLYTPIKTLHKREMRTPAQVAGYKWGQKTSFYGNAEQAFQKQQKLT